MKSLRNLTLAEVKKLASTTAKKYRKKDIVIGLIGPLGAGKTVFVKNFAKEFGVYKIKSPTFVISSVYPIQKRLLYHFDFYRLENSQQLAHLGFEETLKASDRILLIEWVDKFPSIRDKCDLLLNFEIVNKKLRNVTIN